ncbi:hypothetical protein [Galbitalea soli]|uniref:Uncharacterized protein n=1 Tax=Galbitalea soli TaxID=1268042 RepID=A0A7C9PNE7_9MICO|nr:hypothetical protein [Galbitalea soli]NEM91349.1 hypothetical protein [Galbitalea soli]NYJ30039.1 hypothetical protein [Galbitalea soli]
MTAIVVIAPDDRPAAALLAELPAGAVRVDPGHAAAARLDALTHGDVLIDLAPTVATEVRQRGFDVARNAGATVIAAFAADDADPDSAFLSSNDIALVESHPQEWALRASSGARGVTPAIRVIRPGVAIEATGHRAEGLVVANPADRGRAERVVDVVRRVHPWVRLEFVGEHPHDIGGASFVLAFGDARLAAAALAAGRIAIVDDSGAAREALGGHADYAHFGTVVEPAETLLAYLDAPARRAEREAQIARDFSAPSWNDWARQLADLVERLPAARQIAARPRPERLQWVFISNVPESLRRTIALLDDRVDWVAEYVVIAPESLRAAILAIPAGRDIRFVAEEGLLGDRLAEFRGASHTRKNWMLRSRIPSLPAIDDEFIMLDDDNQPVAPIALDVFLDPDRRYRAHYFYELSRWPHRVTDFDRALHTSLVLLRARGMELLAYASHQPQIINRGVFAEAVEFAERNADGGAIEEWSIYFNLLASRYPTLVDKTLYRSLGWPQTPAAWAAAHPPADLRFENYYPESYEGDTALLDPSMSAAEKQRALEAIEAPYAESRRLFEELVPVIRQRELAHGAMVFERGADALIVTGVPQVLVACEDAPLRIPLGFARLGAHGGPDAQFCYRVLGQDLSHGVSVEDAHAPSPSTSTGLIEMAFPGAVLPAGVYALEFFALLAGEPVFPPEIVYRSRLVVAARGERLSDALARL